ncbi:cupin domain-containing protein [Niveomyces insectorum RCEF 264]|uniref:Cupin domain-containing protein n=1 Tax=Niveomyces insectorum RCEF 264 TaxID=1081102 RepID=A0A167UIA3_9HYPO|nr:cupin domain-containing protein [Niveomyces insectorum RCEF 264]
MGVVVVAVNEQGEGYFEPDPAPDANAMPGGAGLRFLFETPTIPIAAVRHSGRDEFPGLASDTGVRFVESEMPPGQRSPMHSTPSVDLGAVTQGTVKLILDSGATKTLQAGDTYILKAANHAWENVGSGPVKIVTVFLAAKR